MTPPIAERLEWFQDLKVGFFMHWGPYSQWGCIESWPLVEEETWARPDDLPAWIERGKNFERFKEDYFALNRTFNPLHFDPEAWAEVAHEAGTRYVVFTTKHHDGFCMFDTRTTNYRITAPECPFHTHPRSNVTKEIFDAFRARGFGIAAYFSKADWHCPYYWKPGVPARTRNPNYDPAVEPERWRAFVEYTHQQIEELMTDYGRIDILWLDAGQVRPPKQDIQMDRLVAMARSHHPDLLVVDRTVGGEYENYLTPEQEIPEKPLPAVWESCITMGEQWSFKPNDRYKSARTLIHLLVEVVAKGGNLLLNVGPQPDGRLPEEAVARLREVGAWMRVNGEAIYGTRPLAPYKEGPIAFTRKRETVYAIFLLPEDSSSFPAHVFLTGIPFVPRSVEMLGAREPLEWHARDWGFAVEIPLFVRESPPCDHAFTLRFRP